MTLAVSEFLGGRVTGTLDGTLHYQIIQSRLLNFKVVLHGTGDLEGYKVQLDFADGGTCTGTVFWPAVEGPRRTRPARGTI